MNPLLRRVAEGVKYRPLPDLASRGIQLEHFATATDDVSTWLAGRLPWPLRFQGPEPQYRGLAFLKYDILDLHFSVNDFHWAPADSGGVPLLEKLGFVAEPGDDEDDDPTCLATLDRDIQKDEPVFLLFLEIGDPNWLERQRRNEEARRTWDAMDPTSEEFRQFLERYFPLEIVVADACIANARFLWMHKHFYL